MARWQHKTYGLLSADSFIPLAEERGLIVQLGEWALRRACADAKRWPGIKVAINVSPIQFRQKDFVASVNRVLTDSGIDAQRVELELTEGVIIADADLAEHSMIDLRALGVHMVLDDFGTGYSSLIYLRRFAFDKIKIDRSFLEFMEESGESAIIVRSIVDLGRSLGSARDRGGDRNRGAGAIPAVDRLRRIAGLFVCAANVGRGYRPAP